MSLKKVSIVSRAILSNIISKGIRNRTVPSILFVTSQRNGAGTNSNLKYTSGVLLSAGLLSLLKKDDEEETPEQKLIMTIKRSILCIQREEYNKAEQMLHLALRMAQDIQSKDGITYVYDLLANLAMEKEEFVKAEKLFVDVMKRLFADGFKEDDVKILHISSKIAHISQLEGQFEKAVQGFKWTLQKLEEKIQEIPDDKELKELWGLTKNWYGQALLENKNYAEAKKNLLEAYQIFTEFNGKLNAETLTMLNNLSVACTYLDDFTAARNYLNEALDLANELPEMAESGMLKANLGLLYLKQGLLRQAKDACTFAWRLGKKLNDKETVEQADRCLKLINEFDK